MLRAAISLTVQVLKAAPQRIHDLDMREAVRRDGSFATIEDPRVVADLIQVRQVLVEMHRHEPLLPPAEVLEVGARERNEGALLLGEDLYGFEGPVGPLPALAAHIWQIYCTTSED